jgi:ribA/ribD-fused uncharacterized protein
MTKLTLDTDTHVFFYEQDFYVLSNFSAFNVYWRGVNFQTLEHAYHWEKFAYDLYKGQRQPVLTNIRHRIETSRSAHDAFKFAQEHKAFYDPDWDIKKYPTMCQLMRAKADQHTYVKKKLLETGDRIIVENSWRDSYWGWGEDRQGLNMAGKAWMEVREEYREEMRDQVYADRMTDGNLPQSM